MPRSSSKPPTSKHDTLRRYLERAGVAGTAVTDILSKVAGPGPTPEAPSAPVIDSYSGARDVRAQRLPDFVVQLPKVEGDFAESAPFYGLAGTGPLKIARRRKLAIKQSSADEE